MTLLGFLTFFISHLLTAVLTIAAVFIPAAIICWLLWRNLPEDMR